MTAKLLNENHSLAEKLRQTELQQFGLNHMTAEQALHNLQNGNRQSSSKRREEIQIEIENESRKSLRVEGYSPADADGLAKAFVREFFRKQDLTHNPDLNLSGPDVLLSYGDRGVNRALGNFSKQERDAFEAWLKTQRPDHVISVKVTPETGPGAAGAGEGT